MEVDWIYTLDLIGTFVFAVSGIMAGIDQKFDLLGSATLGLVTAVGGGTLRDILIGQTPVGWMLDLNYLMLILIALPLCYLWKRHILKLRKGLFLFDTIGIGLFTILGLQKTLEAGLSPMIAITMGAVSATFGGVIRDVLSNVVPLLFRKEIYASACLAGGMLYVILDFFIAAPVLNMVLSMAVIIIIRYLAVQFNWSLNINPRS